MPNKYYPGNQFAKNAIIFTIIAFVAILIVYIYAHYFYGKTKHLSKVQMPSAPSPVHPSLN
jgi:hypothetical protein